MFINIISAGNHSGYPFTVTGWEQERVTLVLKGHTPTVENGGEGGEEKSCYTPEL